jgi:hypothetical protein
MQFTAYENFVLCVSIKNSLMKNAILFIALLAFVSSCKKQPSVFNDKITITPSQELPGNRLLFNCITDRVYPNSYSKINYSIETKGQNITISFSSVSVPAGPGNSGGQAFAAVGFDDLANGNYQLTINNGSRQSVGTLTITDDRYTLYFNVLNDVTFTHYELMHTPPNTIFGTFSYADISQSAVADSLNDSLMYYGAKPFTGPGGNYGDFQLGIGNVVSGLPQKYAYARSFIYDYGANGDAIKVFMVRFAGRNHGMHSYDYAYDIRTGDGKNFEYPVTPIYVYTLD